MAKTPIYADALRILGQNDSAVLDLAEKIVDGGLGAAGVPDLFGVRGEIVTKGRELLTGIREKITGVSRWDRTQRVDAAHQILVVVSILEALDEVLDDPEFAESVPPTDQLEAFTRQVVEDFVVRFPPGVSEHPMAHADWAGSAATRHAHPSTVSVEQRSVTDESFARGLRRFQEHYRQLAADVAEFGIWVNLDEHARTRTELATGLSELENLLTEVSPTHRAQQHARELNTLYRRALWRPVLSGDDAPDHLTLPTLEQSYIAPRARAAAANKECRPAAEDWWATEATPHDDVPALLTRCLTQVWCATRPIVILGHPGAGKSKLTEMLAARMPANDFLAIRVELRGVSADAPLHKQIEQAVSGQVHRDVAWRDLAESVPGAQPVVILDGFDELLQATGVNHSDYLEQVQRFQEHQAAMGQPVAVIVTSRTVVADRLRFPLGCALIRLEPFNEHQIARMLDTWKSANADALANRGIRPLTLETALRYRELTEQPLLLLMLLLYDADGNALETRVDALSRSELYERMLTMFARREVIKHRPDLAQRDIDATIERELNRLEVAAVAMFSRGRQSVAAAELERDLAALLPAPAEPSGDTGLHGTLSEAHQVLGRFFFVHESRAHLDGRDVGVYEFLHATFAEFLVARMVTTTLGELVDDRRRGERRRFAAPLDDGLLYAITSFTVLASQAAVVEFTAELLDQRLAGDPDVRDEYRALLITLFQEAPYPAPARSFATYEPWRADVLTRHASYTANLATLLVCVCEELDIAELLPGHDATWQAWRRIANQWRGLADKGWHGLVNTIRCRHLDFQEGRGHTRIERERHGPVNVGECVGFESSPDIARRARVSDPYAVSVDHGGITSALLRSTALRANGTAARTFLLLGPYLRHVSTDPFTWYSDHHRGDPDSTWNELHDILELRLAPPPHAWEDRLLRYMRLLEGRRLGQPELLVLRQVADDLDAENYDGLFTYLSADDLPSVVQAYLRRVESVVPDSRLTHENVALVLDRLRRFMWVPNDVDNLLDERDHREPADTVDQDPKNEFGHVHGHSPSATDRGQESDRPSPERRPRDPRYEAPGSSAGP